MLSLKASWKICSFINYVITPSKLKKNKKENEVKKKWKHVFVVVSHAGAVFCFVFYDIPPIELENFYQDE